MGNLKTVKTYQTVITLSPTLEDLLNNNKGEIDYIIISIKIEKKYNIYLQNLKKLIVLKL